MINEQKQISSLKDRDNQETNQSSVVLYVTKTNNKFTVSEHIRKFSNLLDVEHFDQDKIFQLPSFIDLNEKIMNIITNFIEIHDNNPANVFLRQIKEETRLSQAFQVNNVELSESQKLSKQMTQKFINKYLNDLSNKQIKQLLFICKFFQIESLKILIYLMLAKRYNPKLGICQIRDQSLSGKKLTKTDINELKRKYLDFFIDYGRKIQEDYITQLQLRDKDKFR